MASKAAWIIRQNKYNDNNIYSNSWHFIYILLWDIKCVYLCKVTHFLHFGKFSKKVTRLKWKVVNCCLIQDYIYQVFAKSDNTKESWSKT